MCFMPGGLNSAAICQKKVKITCIQLNDVWCNSLFEVSIRWTCVCVHSARNEKNWMTNTHTQSLWFRQFGSIGLTNNNQYG